MKTSGAKLGFVGTGTVGSALARLFAEKGYAVAAIYDTNSAAAKRLTLEIRSTLAAISAQAVADASDIVFITTPDSAISSVAGSVTWRAGQAVVHCSGADSSLALKSASDSGAHAGVFHPLQTFASVEQAMSDLVGATIGIEAGEPLLSTLKQMASALGASSIVVKLEDKALYHASAVFVSNYVVTLAKLATDLWKTRGIP